MPTDPASPLAPLTQRAREIRAAFDAHNTAAGRPTWTPLQLAQGFSADVGALNKLLMMRAGLREAPPDLDARLAHELADCLWSILVLADAHGIDLEKSFHNTMDSLEAKLRP
ncbi:nucleotide pyrophosphohydrolase [Nibricoccus aquaticus]|uniref:Nucleotide pyrophosphohydrolase n=1 Tax=Nibricoccus aquaticus TaxID=2576891 RepID=A0A290QD09_9BACT|nr:MazG nucleotide pyrophosphohydrolase domain-containing protein [Nibricoccus aquaticus]ATC64136.1 nucleotide pyrophosphohydrolase [Nibricoccus aquaticus]